jgi:hypothetical protein
MTHVFVPDLLDQERKGLIDPLCKLCGTAKANPAHRELESLTPTESDPAPPTA